MAPSSSSSTPFSSSKSPSSPLPPPHHPPHFNPIQECDREDQGGEDDYGEERSQTARDKREYNTRTSNTAVASNSNGTPSSRYHPTPLHEKKKKPNTATTRPEDADQKENTNWVSCNKCRPSAREKISVVPLDNNNNNGVNKHSSFSNIPSPNALFKSIVSSLTKKSPQSTTSVINPREEQWKVAIAEISHKLIQATRRRDEAIIEASRLKISLSELEKKLNKLEVYCQNLKSGLDECASSSSNVNYKGKTREEINNGLTGVISEKVIEQFLVSVSEARSNIRLLSRALTMQLRHVGGKVFERLSLLLQPYDVKITSISKNPKSVVVYMEALLNRAFFEDFESIGFQKSSVSQILNPIDRCEANYASFNVLKELTWEEVLNKGTRHFSEEFSKFCDRKMSEIVAMLGWNRAWPEPLLQAFFGASKSVWLVHLLANSLHPGLPIFRVDNWVGFDPVYMEDMGMGGDHHRAAAKKLVPTMVRIMVAPGFYVYGNVVKCKVLCRYYSCNGLLTSSDKGLTPSP